MKWDIGMMPSQAGKRFLITGANSGLGFQCAKELVAKDAEVIMAVRNLAKGKQARETILQSIPSAKIDLAELDLSDLDSVNICVEQLIQRDETIDVLVNNAGIMFLFGERSVSQQGHEVMWATNHLGHFAFTAGILPLIERAEQGRIVVVSSLVTKFKQADIYYQDLNFEQSYDGMSAYAQSKLANVMFAAELQQRLLHAGSKVIAVAAHPGYTATNLQQHMGWLGKVMNTLFAQNLTMGTLPLLQAATDNRLTGGEYIGPKNMNNYRGYPSLNALPEAANDVFKRRRLWQKTEEILEMAFLSNG